MSTGSHDGFREPGANFFFLLIHTKTRGGGEVVRDSSSKHNRMTEGFSTHFLKPH